VSSAPRKKLEPEITQRPLPEETRAVRAHYEQAMRGLEELLRPRLEGHLLVLQGSIDRLVELHAAVVDQSDIELGAETRWAALWELSGRCLALANLFVAELRMGITAETAGTIRVTDEAAHLLHAVAADEDGALARRWLRAAL
jgi:hypothetical protein